ncbi:MAG TPA: DHH family phosphoesterase [Tepidisphaeraceae bacterium]|nr:DHH family phosphoesterase [Tepidisphaeraceae bacterium]
MTAFVESCVGTVSSSAVAVARRSRGRPHARALVKLLADKRNILITTHEHPDPDALASTLALCSLLSAKLPNAKITTSAKGRIGGGINEIFAQLTNLKLSPWNEADLKHFDAIILVDTQPNFANSPLPPDVAPTAVIDHHRGRVGRRPKCPFCDIRSDVGATGSIIFSYFMELEQPISRDLGATLLYAIESDLAGAAGQPGELDNIALSSLTLIADTRKLYKMRYVNLPQSSYISMATGLQNAVVYDNALLSHLEEIDSPEKPAVMADFLLRFDKADWALVTAVFNGTLVMSLRTNNAKLSAADLIKRLLRNIGEGGGHRTKAGGGIKLANGTPTQIERLRGVIRRRFLRALRIEQSRGQRLVPPMK